jgi:hypothetical protein
MSLNFMCCDLVCLTHKNEIFKNLLSLFKHWYMFRPVTTIIGLLTQNLRVKKYILQVYLLGVWDHMSSQQLLQYKLYKISQKLVLN